MITHPNTINRYLTGFFLAITLLVYSCDYSYIDGLDKIQPYTYSPIVAAPLVNSSLGMDEIIGQANFDELYIDDDGLIWLVYKGSVPVVSPHDIILIPNQAENFFFPVIPAALAGQSIVIENDLQFNLPANVTLDSIKFLTGRLNLGLNAPTLVAEGYSISSTFEILQSRAAGSVQPIRGTATLLSNANIDLAGTSLNLSHPGNYVTVRHLITLVSHTASPPSTDPYIVSVNISLTGMDYESITGTMNTTGFPIGGTRITLDIFENLGLEETTFEAPRIYVTSRNTFDIPFDITVDQFVAINTENNTMVNLALPPQYSPWQINTPAFRGDTAITLATLHRDNSNLGAIAQINPNQFVYNISGIINPDGPQSNHMRHNSTLTVDVEINIPLWGRVRRYFLDDTINNPLDTIPNEVEWAEINLNIENGFPIEALIQVYFADALGNKIDSLFSRSNQDNLIAAAQADPVTGVANQPQSQNKRIMLTQSKIESLRRTNTFIIEAELMTYNQRAGQNVKILYTNLLDIQIGARIKAAVELEL